MRLVPGSSARIRIKQLKIKKEELKRKKRA
jgi:hypothetical protein